MIDLVDRVRHADEMIINDLIFAVAQRFAELYPDQDLLMISVDKNRDCLQQIYDNVEFLEQLTKKYIRCK